MSSRNDTLPGRLSELHRLPFDYEEGIDFEPFDRFMSAEETADWFRAWTGNPDVDGGQFRVFGQDGTGGYAALWLTLPDQPVEFQPIVFLGSEGEQGVVARNIDEYLWLLAEGVGPFEAIAYSGEGGKPNPAFMSFAETHSKISALTAIEVIANANAAFPGFGAHIDSHRR